MPNMHLSLLLQNILKRGSTYLVFLFIYHSLPIKIPTGQTGTKVQMEGIPGLTWLSFYPRVKVASYAFSTSVTMLAKQAILAVLSVPVLETKKT